MFFGPINGKKGKHEIRCGGTFTMMGIGFPELMIILVIIMIIFGAGKLPEIGSAFGRSIKNFKTSMKEAEEGETLAGQTGETASPEAISEEGATSETSVSESVETNAESTDTGTK